MPPRGLQEEKNSVEWIFNLSEEKLIENQAWRISGESQISIVSDKALQSAASSVEEPISFWHRKAGIRTMN